MKGFNGVFSRNNLPKLKNGAYIINLDHNKNTGTHWVVIFVEKDEVIYFDSFGVECIPKEIMKRIEHGSLGNKHIKTNIFRIQDNNSIMCGYFCILFIEYILNDKTLNEFFMKKTFGFKSLILKMMETINLEFKELLEDQSNYRLNEINNIKDYFNEEIQYQQSFTNKLTKYLTVFDYSNKILTLFSGTNIFSNVKNKQLLGLITSEFSLSFSLSFGIIIKLQQETNLRKKKHNKLLYLAKNKLDCIEMLISNSIRDGITSHDEFLEILKEKEEYNGLKNEDKIENA